MMPSRGASVLRGIAPQVRNVHSRSFSIAHTARRPRSITPSRAVGKSRWNLVGTGIVLTPLGVARNASTASVMTSSNSSTAAPEITSPAPTSSNIPDLDTVNIDNLDFSTPLAGLEKIGYLKELGIDYGWGITSTLQWMVEHYHIWGDLPWWAAIAATAVTLRVITLPLTLRASDAAARAQAMAPVLKPYQDRMKQYQKEGNQQMVQIELQQWMMARKEAGVSFTAMLGPPIAQGIAGYCGFRLMHKMASLPVPGLRDGGFLWLTDLTVPDGYLILPGLLAVSMHLIIRFGGEAGTSQLTGGMQKFMLWGMPLVIFVITGWQAGALAVWFTASGALSMATGLALKNARVRQIFGLTPLYKPQPAATPPVSQAFGLPLTSATPAAATSTVAATAQGTSQTPKAGYMRPVYQAPNIRRSGDSSRTLNTTLTHAPSTGPQAASTPNSGMFGSLKASYNNAKASADEFNKNRVNKRTQKRRDAAAQKAIDDRRSRAQR